MKFGIESGIDLYCVECGKDVSTIVQSGEVIYPHRPDLADTVYLQCPHCKNFVGADKLGSNDSLRSWQRRHEGKVIPNAEVKEWRRKIHALVDPCWESGLISRKEVYQRLSKAVGGNFHNASLRSKEVYEKAHKAAKKIRREAEVLNAKKLPPRDPSKAPKRRRRKLL